MISNSMAIVADVAFSLSMNEELTLGMAWLGAIAYTFQIFFDFSGYSDMAIGLGKMFGFHFLENFNYPYISKSATEFWRRWHISLGTWFRDYVYIPLGGSRVKLARNIFNLFIVWICTGVWHGANWTFIAWGMLYFVLLVFEKFTGINKESKRLLTNVIKHVYTMFSVIIGWVLFRADNLSEAGIYLGNMFTLNHGGWIDASFIEYVRQYGVYFVIAIICSTPIFKVISEKCKRTIITDICYVMIIMVVFLISVSFIVKGSYNPFIYFNF